jgi:hypothetical protein
MDFTRFKSIVDSCPDEITPIAKDLEALCAYVFGSPPDSANSGRSVSEELISRIAAEFTSGAHLVPRHSDYDSLVEFG